jgi:hypothetical protein
MTGTPAILLFCPLFLRSFAYTFYTHAVFPGSTTLIVCSAAYRAVLPTLTRAAASRTFSPLVMCSRARVCKLEPQKFPSSQLQLESRIRSAWASIFFYLDRKLLRCGDAPDHPPQSIKDRAIQEKNSLGKAKRAASGYLGFCSGSRARWTIPVGNPVDGDVSVHQVFHRVVHEQVGMSAGYAIDAVTGNTSTIPVSLCPCL